MPTLPWTTPNQPGPDVQAVVMASRLEVRSFKDVPRFFLLSLKAWRQVKTASGAFDVSLIAQPIKRTFWTLSTWEDRKALYTYVKAEPHQSVMNGLRPTMRQSVFTFWEVPANQLPIDWAEAKRHLAQQADAEARNTSGG